MVRFYCDYCDSFLTHDSPAVRKQHNSGYKHKSNVKAYYLQFEDDGAQDAIEQQIQEFQRGRGMMPPGGPGGFMGGPYMGGPPRPGFMGGPPPYMGGPPRGPPHPGMMHPGGPGMPPYMGGPPRPGMGGPPHGMGGPPPQHGMGGGPPPQQHGGPGGPGMMQQGMPPPRM